MSTLHVENLKGLSSGGNANKIIVPSGQTIDASAGTLVPSVGQIVQTVTHQWTSAHTQTSTSFADVSGSSFSFTPKYATSKLVLTSFTEENVYAASSAYAGGHVRFMIDTTAQADYASGNDYQLYIEAGGATLVNTHLRQSKCIAVNATNTTARTIKLQARIYHSSTTRLAVNYNNAYLSIITVQEIAQ